MAWRRPLQRDRRDEALVDEMIISYVCWREATAEVWAAYRLWVEGAQDDDSRGFHGYSASLEREEKAASVYATCVKRVERRSRSDAEVRLAPSGEIARCRAIPIVEQ